MSDSGTDRRTVAAQSNDGELLSPADLASQVASFAGNEAGVRGSELPMWDRLAGPPRVQKRLFRLLPVAAWCVTLGLLVVAMLRIFCHDATLPLTMLNAFTLYLYLPAYLVFAFAAWTGRGWLAAASVAVAACHLTWVLPDFRSATAYAPPVAENMYRSDPIKIFYANVRGASNSNMESVLTEARRCNPDVIVIAEMQRQWWLEMIDKNPLKEYPYGTNLQHRNAGDIGLFSRLPIQRMEQILVESRTSLVADISLGRETLRLFAIHSPRPMPRMKDNYFNFWRKIEPILTEQRGPVLAIGDFNATQHSLVYEQFQANRMRSAHEDRGRGFATTWPNGKQPVPPIRVDQAFLSPEVECISIAEGVGSESDHKPLILEIQVHASSPAGAAL